MRIGSKTTASRNDRTRAKRLLTVLVVLCVAVPVATGGVAAQDDTDDGNETTYSVWQEGECVQLTAYSGEQSVTELYDYRAPHNDSSVNGNGGSFSSEGTTEIQQPNESTMFLYEDGNGTLSLVIVHGANKSTSGSGSVTFNITDLPEDGEWTVKDDAYDGPRSYDNWTHTDEYHRIDWTWDERRTDGGAYSGLGDEFKFVIDPAFNEEAALYGEQFNGTLDGWAVISGTGSDLERTQLDGTDPVGIASMPCDE